MKILKDYHVHSVFSDGKNTLDEIFANHKLIATVEEHNVIGGIGSAVAEYKAIVDNTPRQLFFGFPDSFTEAGTSQYIWEKFGITASQIAERVKNELKKTK